MKAKKRIRALERRQAELEDKVWVCEKAARVDIVQAQDRMDKIEKWLTGVCPEHWSEN